MENNKLKELRERREFYRQAEKSLLNGEAVKSYGIGSRNLSRHDLSLTDIRKAIKELDRDIQSEEARAKGRAPRRVLGGVPREY